MILETTLCTLLLFAIRCQQIECRSYDTGLIFYNLENRNTYLPPTISVSRGRGLAKFKYSSRGSIWSTFGRPCDCSGPLCGCCVGIRVQQYNFDQKICANVTYARPKNEVQLEVFLNETSSAKYGISARNPSPLCIPIMMGIPMAMCIQMSNIAVQADNLNMCMDFLVRLASTELFEMHFQCMKVGLQGASWVGPDGQPVIPANEGKLKDKNPANSGEYYDEGETENDIILQKEIIESESVTEKDVNKAEEEMDSNDITEKIMDIVKEKEVEEAAKDSSEIGVVNSVEGIFGHLQDNPNVEEIVTNIMDSINKGNAMQEIHETKEMPSKMEIIETGKENVKEKPEQIETGNSVLVDATVTNNKHQVIETGSREESKEDITKASNATMIENVTKSDMTIFKQELHDAGDQHLNNEVEISEDMLEKQNQKEEFNIEDLFEDSMEKEMQMESDQIKTLDTMEASTQAPQHNIETAMTPIIVLEESTTKHVTDDVGMATFGLTEVPQNTNYDEKPNLSMDIKQTATESNSQPLTEGNNTQEITLTSAANDINVMNNSSSITANIMPTTTKTTTTTNKTIKLNANFATAAALTNNTRLSDGYKVDDGEGDGEGEEEDEDSDSDSSADDSFENDSDYEDDESDETETENITKEETIEFHNAATITNSNALPANSQNGNDHKESLILQEVANNFNSNESQSVEDNNENTNDQFEIEEGEEYDDEFDDYETTTAAVATLTSKPVPVIMRTTIKPLNHNNKTVVIPQIDTAATNNLKSVSQTGDKHMLNIKSTNRTSPAIIDSTTADSSASMSSINANKGRVLPLPLARKWQHNSMHRREQQPPQQLKQSQNRQVLYYV